MSVNTNPKPSPIVCTVSRADQLRDDFNNIIVEPDWIKYDRMKASRSGLADSYIQLCEAMESLYVKILNASKKLDREAECIKLFNTQYNNLIDLEHRLRMLLGDANE